MTISEFIKKWGKVRLSERSAAQQHFLELCDVFGHPKPSDADPDGECYTFEKGVANCYFKGLFRLELRTVIDSNGIRLSVIPFPA